jgi:phosphosulfolactate synthase
MPKCNYGKRDEQAWFIALLGVNVNLGNISLDDVIPLETLKIWLRGDTFTQFTPETGDHKNR